MAEVIWRFLNYLCVGMLYLKDDVILARDLCMEDFKTDIVGHWGTCPGVNAIYSHLMAYCIKHKNHNTQIKLVISMGHAAPSLLAAGFLDGTLQRYYPEFSRDAEGIKKLFNAYGNTFSSEIDVKYPGNIYCGGELGSGLAFSQGYVFNHPERIVACVIGDGEFETPVCQASFQGFNLMDRQRDGRVFPIINLNGFKMGCKSTLADKTDEDIAGYFKFFGLDTFITNDCHDNIADAVEKCFKSIQAGRFPILVIKTPKGWTAPKVMGGMTFEGSHKSHKPILKHPYCNYIEFEEVKNWLESYNISTFFSAGNITPEIINFMDAAGESIIDFNRRYDIKPLNVNYNNHFDSNTTSCYKVLSNQNTIIIFSPDELDSNGLGKVRTSCRVIELLSEQTCFGWAYGYAAGGGVPVLVTYEAFAPLFDSMVDQYLKMSEAMNCMEYTIPSINIIITSLGWKNVPSHHNPGFVDRLMGYNSSQISLFFPLSPANTVQRLEECLSTTNKLNVIIMDKRKLPILYHKAIVKNDGYWILHDGGIKRNYLLVVVIGDIVAEEVLKAYDLLSSDEMKRLKIVGLDAPLTELDSLMAIIHDSIFNIWLYNGRPNVVESLLWKHCLSSDKNLVLGYAGKSRMSSGKGRLQENNIDAVSLAETMMCVLKMKEQG